MKPILLLLLAATLSCRSANPPERTDPALRDIDAFVANVARTIPEVPSIGIAIVQNGVQNGQRHARAFGYADREKQVPATAQTGYYIGSTTKGFTGLTAAILAEQGKLDLDAPIARYLPEVRFGEGIDTQKLTLRLLLSHTVTIENHPLVFRTAFTGEHTPATLLQLLGSSKPRSDSFRYDNLGYVVTGLVFQRVTGRTWQQLHEELIFAPLGMKRTTAYMAKAQAIAMPYEMTSS